MVEFSSMMSRAMPWLTQKYDLQRREAGASETRAQAAQTAASAAMSSAAAEGARADSDALRAGAEVATSRAQLPYVGGLIKAQTQGLLGGAARDRAQAGMFTRGGFSPRIGSFDEDSYGTSYVGTLGLKAKGETKVPGKGSGKVDKVPRLLAPGEAVLNKAAAGMLGRKKIAELNKKGAKKMGLV